MADQVYMRSARMHRFSAGGQCRCSSRCKCCCGQGYMHKSAALTLMAAGRLTRKEAVCTCFTLSKATCGTENQVQRQVRNGVLEGPAGKGTTRRTVSPDRAERKTWQLLRCTQARGQHSQAWCPGCCPGQTASKQASPGAEPHQADVGVGKGLAAGSHLLKHLASVGGRREGK